MWNLFNRYFLAICVFILLMNLNEKTKVVAWNTGLNTFSGNV